MNNTETESTGWRPQDIIAIITAGVTVLTLLINVHQSYKHRHIRVKSECCGLTYESDSESDKKIQDVSK